MFRQPAFRPLLSRSVRTVALAFAAFSLTASGTLLYDTGFETTDTPAFVAGVGTASSPKLVGGSTGWTMAVGATSGTIDPSTCYPFAGIDSDKVPGMGQTAALGYLGSTDPPSNAQFIRVGHKLATEPVVAGGMAIVDFYCQIGLKQSTNGHQDEIDLFVYNFDDKMLGGLAFDLAKNKVFRYDANEFNVGYIDSPYTDTGMSLTSLYGKVMEVSMRVNYNTNTWSATVNSVQVVNNATFTKRPTSGTNAAARTFGSMQARWYIATPGSAGYNWLLFDDWMISAYVEPTIPATASADYPANSTASITVTDASSAGWTLASDQTWAVVTPSSGTGTTTATVKCAANPNTTPRTANITVGSHTCVLTQAATPATTNILPTAASAGYAANSTAVIAVTSNTTWNASSDHPWAVVSPVSGSGNGNVTATCSLNATALTRSAAITVGTQTCLLTQAASPYAIWASSLAGGAQDFGMDADHDGVINGMEYALGRNAADAAGVNGISQLPVISATGSGTLRQLAMTLSLPEPAPADIVYDVQVADGLTGLWTNIIEKNGTGPWTALGNSGATMTSSPNGSGRTSFTLTDVQGRHFMRLAITSTSTPPSVTSISPTASSLYAANSIATIQVTSNTTWTAASDRSWAVVSPASGNGNGTVTVTCAANTGVARSTTITIGGQTCVLTQAASPYALWAATLPAGQQGFYQDADSDGVINGMEYALGRSATSAAGDNGAAQLPVITWTDNGVSPSPALSINLPTTAPEDVTYDVQVSNSLTDVWTTIMEKTGNNPWAVIGASGATVSSAPAGTGRTLYVVTDGQLHHFLRLQIAKTP